MFAYPLRTAALAAAAMIGLSGCGYNGLYNGVSVGIGNGGYYDPYYGGYGYGGYGSYSRYGYGYGFDPYWGWNDGFYYPGTGYYVYDRYRRPFRWSDAQRRYWELRRERALRNSRTGVIEQRWEDFTRDRNEATGTRVVTSADSPVQVERGVERQRRIERSIENRRDRAERRSSRAETRSTVRQERQSESRSSSRISDHVSRARGRGSDNRDD